VGHNSDIPADRVDARVDKLSDEVNEELNEMNV
jgi:hypothetical protein